MYSRFSPKFVEVCLHGEFRPGDPLPCPKCDRTEVVFQNPRRWLPVAGVVGLAALLLLLVGQTILGQCVALVAVGIGAGSAFSEAGYTCRNCGYHWRYRDAVKWANAIRHDAISRGESQAKRPQ